MIIVCSLVLILGAFCRINAQVSSSLLPDRLTFLDSSNPLVEATYRINGLNIQNGFSFSSITPFAVSAGGDLLRAIADGNGFTVRDFALFPASKGNLDLKALSFVTEGQGSLGLDQETWSFGITKVGDFDGSDPVQSALFLRYSRVIDDVSIYYPLLFVNPDEGNMGMGTNSQNFNAQLYVEEYGQDQIAVSGNNTSSTNAARWGVYGICQGNGTGIRYGVVGQAFSSSGMRYGVLGTADPTFGYAVYASGNMAYTGSITDVSDRKFKKNIEAFEALDRVMQLQPKTYEMKQEAFERMNLASGRRYGFIAQELQEVFPDLVKEQVDATPFADGDSLNVEPIDYLGVEYVPMIPILTRAMQEQQVQIEEQKDRMGRIERENQVLQRENRDLRNRLDQLETLVEQIIQGQGGKGQLNSSKISDARLDQNQPNPFGSSTSISHFIPIGIRSAKLEVADAQGRVLKSMVISGRGQGKTMLETDLLSGGIYFYSLILDGKVVDTKRMIAVK